MLIGYEDSLGTKAYRVLCVDRNRVYVSRDVRFMGRMFKEDGPTPDVSLLTVDGIKNVKSFSPAEQAIANVVLARTLANADQQDSARLETFTATVFALAAADAQATSYHTPTSFWDMLKTDEKNQWFLSMQEEEDAVYSNKVVREIDRNQVPEDAEILNTLWAYKNKSNE